MHYTMTKTNTVYRSLPHWLLQWCRGAVYNKVKGCHDVTYW